MFAIVSVVAGQCAAIVGKVAVETDARDQCSYLHEEVQGVKEKKAKRAQMNNNK